MNVFWLDINTEISINHLWVELFVDILYLEKVKLESKIQCSFDVANVREIPHQQAPY